MSQTRHPPCSRPRAELVAAIVSLTVELAQLRRAVHALGCYACDADAIGVRDRRTEGGGLELACARHAEIRFVARLRWRHIDGELWRAGAYAITRTGDGIRWRATKGERLIVDDADTLLIAKDLCDVDHTGVVAP